MVRTLICCARLTQDSRNALNLSRTEKKARFLNLFAQISGGICTVVGRGYLFFSLSSVIVFLRLVLNCYFLSNVIN